MPPSGTYLIDGVNFYTTYKVIVERVRGHQDFLKRKGKTGYSYPDSDGETAFTDATDIFFEPRIILLYCRIETDTAADFKTKLDALKVVLNSAGERVLTIPYPTSTTYNVYFKDGGKINLPKNWIANKYIGKFVLRFVEPEPTRPS